MNAGSEPPSWLRLHYAIVAMAFGELALEGGMVLNLIFWFTHWLTEAQAQALALTWLILTSLTMSVVLISLWRDRQAALMRVLPPWLLLFHGGAITVFFVLGPAMGIRL